MAIASRHPARRHRQGTLDNAVARARSAAATTGDHATWMIAVGTRAGPVALTDARPAPDAEVGLVADAFEALQREVDEGSERRREPRPRSVPVRGIACFAGITVSTVLEVLDQVAADPALVAATWTREPRQAGFTAIRAIERARLEPNGLRTDLTPHDGTADAAAAILALHMTVLRARTPAQRRAVRAVRDHGNVVAAADALGCSHQAVSRALRRADVSVSDATIIALRAVRDPAK